MGKYSEGLLNMEKALLRLRQITQATGEINNIREKEISKIKGRHADKLYDLVHEEVAIRAAILAHCKTNRKEIFAGGLKSVKFLNGVVGFRTPPFKISISKVKEFPELARKVMGKKADNYLNIKVTPDKEALRKLGADILKKLGIKKTQKEEFFIDLGKSPVDSPDYAKAVTAGE